MRKQTSKEKCISSFAIHYYKLDWFPWSQFNKLVRSRKEYDFIDRATNDFREIETIIRAQLREELRQ